MRFKSTGRMTSNPRGCSHTLKVFEDLLNNARMIQHEVLSTFLREYQDVVIQVQGQDFEVDIPEVQLEADESVGDAHDRRCRVYTVSGGVFEMGNSHESMAIVYASVIPSHINNRSNTRFHRYYG